MKKQEFYSLLADEFNVGEDFIKESTILNSLPDWDSMSILVIMTIVDENFNVTLSAEDFSNINNIRDLVLIIGEDKFE